MYQKALSIYYGLAIFVLATALFVVYPTRVPEFSAWQDGIKQQFSIAWKETIGDQPVFDSVAEVYDGVNEFYNQSADAMISMLNQPQNDQDVIFVFHQMYHVLATALSPHPTGNIAGATTSKPVTIDLPPIPTDFMTKAPLYNLVPETTQPVAVDISNSVIQAGAVSGAVISSGQPVNSVDQPWVTLEDNLTGQLYCLAVYDGTVNKYPGPCKNDYH